MSGRVDGVVVDVSNLDEGEAFWTGLLGLEAVDRRDQYVFLQGLAPGVLLILQEVSDPKETKNRMHLEVQADDPEALVSWVTAHGGSVVSSDQTDWYALTVMADPDGNEFCVGMRPSAARL
ncbi:MAG: VOC family protein [Acidimicrobiia bacterium]